MTSWLAPAGLALWIGYEVLLRRREDTETASWFGTGSDRGSTPILIGAFIASAAAVTLAATFDIGSVGGGWRWLGIAILALGLGVRAWGMAVLGRQNSCSLRFSAPPIPNTAAAQAV